jgi:anti-anti-sigma factor
MSHEAGGGAAGLSPAVITRRGAVVVAEIVIPRLFDPKVVDRLDQDLHAAVGVDDDLILDLTRVRFISSAMLGRMVMLWMAAQKHGRRVVLSGVTGTLAEILRIAGLHQRVQVRPDVATALADLQERRS